MTTISMALKRLLDKAGSEEFLRSALENILQLLMDTDVSGQIKAAWHERTPDRGNYRNGYRERRLASGVGELQLHIPKLRRGSANMMGGWKVRKNLDTTVIPCANRAVVIPLLVFQCVCARLLASHIVTSL